MRRREFIKGIAGATATWPLAAHAQQSERMRHVSVLMAYVESDATQLWKKVFSESLQELGWIVGRNMQLDFHWPGPSSQDLLRADAAEMVRLNPDVLIAVTTPAVVALQHETRSIPIVFVNVADPVGQGIIASFAKPGGNTTGFGAFEIFNRREMGSGNERNCAVGHPGWRDFQPGDSPLLPINLAFR
jgi:putative ABC transport system substrate-binding protein